MKALLHVIIKCLDAVNEHVDLAKTATFLFYITHGICLNNFNSRLAF